MTAEEIAVQVARDALDDADRAVTRARAAHDVALAAYYAACAEMNS